MAKKLSRKEKYERYVQRTLNRIAKYEERGWYIDPAYKVKLEQRMDINPRGKQGAANSTEMITRRMASAKELYKHATLFTDKGTITAKEARKQGYTFTGKRTTPTEYRQQIERMESTPIYYDNYAVSGRNFERLIRTNLGDYTNIHWHGHYPTLNECERMILTSLDSVIAEYGYGELGRRADGRESELAEAFKEMYYHPQTNEDIYYGASLILQIIVNRPLTTTETLHLTKTDYDELPINSEELE